MSIDPKFVELTPDVLEIIFIKYVGTYTRAAEGSDLDQVLSCLRDYSSWRPHFGGLFPGGSSACSTLPDPAGLGVGGARVVSLPRDCVFFCFFAQGTGCGISSIWAWFSSPFPMVGNASQISTKYSLGSAALQQKCCHCLQPAAQSADDRQDTTAMTAAR